AGAACLQHDRGCAIRSDSFDIRATALRQKIPYSTTAAGALATARAIENLKEGALDVAPLQSYNRETIASADSA
ncbi:MAG TPA: hypothetical protein VK090_07820, partial [Paracoccaceae bacterium]|nr:hypothetical protein [Paracoccaceae bacterium]